ncbi:gamma carbonic anhydrase family protein [Massilia sp. Leaf139]|uniref:gamma carbonic anhydrase family protein n=1 Tax=Massilia sp. Leaf139 TaxID=1736272 RepID=UPI0006F47101|nr:gamma carbonic anhydrase family protein [Massilia sp. Leaf139]KQQ97167.1 anhydrase [Massilia sp. Leaf139]
MSISSYLSFVPTIGALAYVHESAQVIGDVRIGEDSSIWCNAVLRGDVNHIEVGRCTNIQDFTMGHVSHRREQNPDGTPLIIGDYVTIGHGVILHGCSIGNDCLIGMGAILMDDVVVQDRVMLGAGSLVAPGKVLESRYLYMGRPARQARALTAEEIAYLRYSAEHYVRLKNNYLMPEKAAPGVALPAD